MERRRIVRSLLALAILATLLIQVSGAQAVFAGAPHMPACCVRVANHPHCAAMAAEVAPPPHRHSGANFVGTPAKCGCTMGLVMSSLFIPTATDSIEISRSLAGSSLDELGVCESSTPTYGQRGPPTI